jgi:cell division protein FtsQ
VRRPTGPAQRAPQRPAQAPRQASVVAERDARDAREQRDEHGLHDDRDEPIAAPVELRARREATGADREADRPPSPSSGARQTGAEPRSLSRLSGWREVRKAAAARRRVERGEAKRFTVRTRRRRQLQLGVAIFVVVVIGGAVATAYSPIMALRHIEVVGAHSVKAAQVQQALAGELGKPLPLVRNTEVRHALDDFRLIESYSTQLEPPSTLVVRIVERTPLAVVKVGSSYELVDQAGVVLEAGARAQTGFPIVALPAGQQPDSSPGFAAAAAVIAALPAQLQSTVTSASATSANNVVLALRGGKQVVWGGVGDIQLKTEVLEALLKGAKGAHVYDVSSPRAPITR